MVFQRRSLIRKNALIRSAILLKILDLIESETGSGLQDAAKQRPEFALLTVADFMEYCGVPVRRSVEIQLANGERAGWIKREFPERHHSRGGYRIDWERLGAAPDPEPRAPRADKGQPKRHAVRGSIAARKDDAVLVPAEPLMFSVSEPVQIPVQPSADSVQAAMGCGLVGGCPLLCLTIKNDPVVVTSVTTVGVPTTLPIEGEHIGKIPDVSPALPNAYFAGFPESDLLSQNVVEPAAFASALARLFALAKKPVPTQQQAARAARSLAGRGLTCGGFLDWCGLDRGRRVHKADSPGILPSWIDEYASYVAAHAAIDAEIERAEREAAERRARSWAEPEPEPEPERPEPRPVLAAVCWRCNGTGELHNLSDPEAFTPCGCAAGRAKKNER